MDPQTHGIIGAAIEVHKEYGPGFLEIAYARALEMEFSDRGFDFVREAAIPMWYKGRPTGVPFRADFHFEPDLIVELKALPSIGNREKFQVLHYLKAAGMSRGLLLNFGQDRLQIERLMADPNWGAPVSCSLGSLCSPRPPEEGAACNV